MVLLYAFMFTFVYEKRENLNTCLPLQTGLDKNDKSYTQYEYRYMKIYDWKLIPGAVNTFQSKVHAEQSENDKI